MLRSIPARQRPCLEDIAVRLIQNPSLCLETQPKSIKRLPILGEMMHVGIHTALLPEFQPLVVKTRSITPQLMKHLVGRRTNLPTLTRRRILDYKSLTVYTVIRRNHCLKGLNRHLKARKRKATARHIHHRRILGQRWQKIQRCHLYNLDKSEISHRHRHNNPIGRMLENP